MANKLDHYAQPIRKEETKLCTKFWFDVRRSKPGRELQVMFDNNFPIAGFKPEFSYIVRFLEKGNAAGDHYHHRKQELMFPLKGEFEIVLGNPATKERETFNVTSSEPIAVYFKTGIAHKVISKKESGIILILASHPSKEDDEIDYDL